MQHLGLLPLFRELTKAELDDAIAHLVPCEVGAGEVLIRQGEVDRSMFVVLDGTVAVTVGDPPAELAQLGPGELVGEMALLSQVEVRSADVHTVTPCQFAILEERALRNLRLRGHPLVLAIEVHAIRTLAARIRSTDGQIARLTAGTVDAPAPRRGWWRRAAGWLAGSGRRLFGRRPDVAEAMARAPAFRGLSARALLELVPFVDVVGVSARTAITTSTHPSTST